MKKIFYMFTCMLTLMQSVCSADVIYSGCVLGDSYAVSVTEQILASNETTSTDNLGLWTTSNDTIGQSFVVTKNGLLTKLTIKINSNVSGDPTVTARIGTTNDVSSSYIEESDTITLTGEGEFTFTFGGTNTLSTGTTYYFFCHSTDAVYSGRPKFITSSDNSYTDGVAQYTCDDWATEEIENADRDLYFIVKGLA